MKKSKISAMGAIAAALCLACTGCANSAPAEKEDAFVNPGDTLGGGGTVATTPTETESSLGEEAKDAVGTVAAGETQVPSTAARITAETLAAGDISVKANANEYYVTGELNGAIKFKKNPAHLYLYNATITATDVKTIASTKDLTITLIGENTVKSVASSDSKAKNAVDSDSALTINGSGSLTVVSSKNGIAANALTVRDARLDITADKDGLHSEIGEYDDATEAPEFSYDAGGFVYLDGADVKIVAASDGIQADTFVCVMGDGKLDIKAGGGAPATVTETSHTAADGKGIKAGAIDWGASDTAVESDDYLILIESGEVNIDSNDDAIHSNAQVEIKGGSISVATGDDGIHADTLLLISGGDTAVTKSYEGLEAATVEISGGKVYVAAVDDGLNAADGTETRFGTANPNCHLIISGGEVTVNAGGDGIDSNGTMLISGGKVFVSGPTNGANAALDSDGGILVNGGYVFAVGALGMVETPATNSSQNVVSYAHSQTVAASTVLTLTKEDGTPILYFESPKTCQSVIISCPELKDGESYCIYGGDTKLTTFTVSSRITKIGSSTGMGNNPGGGKPGKPGGGVGPNWR